MARQATATRSGHLVMVRAGLVGLVILGIGGLTPSAFASHTGLLFGASKRIVVTMSEYKINPSRITLEAGQSVDLVIENKGIISHAFMVYPKPAKPYKSVGDWWEYALANTYFQGMGEITVHTQREVTVDATRVAGIALEPGKVVTLTFTPTRKGTFEMACQLSTAAGTTHFKAGMGGLLVVK